MKSLLDKTRTNSTVNNPNVLKIFQSKVKQTPSNDNAEKLKLMEEYILQDGYEKANEIDVKTDELCRIAFAECYAQLKVAWDQRFEEEEHKVLQQDISKNSKVKNTFKLCSLAGRKEILDKLMTKVKRRFGIMMEDVECRQNILAKLMIQAAVKILEPTVILRVQKNDFHIATQLISQVQKEYLKLTELPIEFILDEDFSLPEATGGGVQLSTPDQRIYVNNTMSKKIELIVDSIHPIIRADLFGDQFGPFSLSQQQSQNSKSFSDYYSLSNAC